MNLSYEQALYRSASFCSKSEKCIADIEKKLVDWGISTHDQERIIEHLKQEKYLDEERFARYFARDKYRFNQWGRMKIRFTLRSKGVADSLIDLAMEEIEEAEYIENLKGLMRAKKRQVKGNSDYEKRMKIARFLQGRGYEPDLIFRMLDQMESEE